MGNVVGLCIKWVLLTSWDAISVYGTYMCVCYNH